MKPLSRLESLIAELVERPAWLLSSRKLHPLALTTALTKVLEERAMRLADRVIAPDRYDLALNAADLAALADARPTLERELAAFVARIVADRDLVCNRPPQVHIVAGAAVRAGKIQAGAEFSHAPEAASTIAAYPGAGAVPRRVGHFELRSEAVGPQAPSRPAAAAARQHGAALVLLGPHGETAYRFDLSARETTIGRRAGVDVPLLDAKVSREHARIERRDGGFVLSDLRSLNGTSVNGEPAPAEHWLRGGEVIQIGHFRLRFVAGDGR